MTNDELYAMIKQNVSQFNKWRLENPEVRVDFSGRDFKDEDLCDALLVNVNLSGAVLEYTNLEYASFCASDLTNVKGRGCYATGAHFGAMEVVDAQISDGFRAFLAQGADLSGADFFRAEMPFANFRNCKLTDTNFKQADLQHAYFVHTHHSEAHFEGAKVEDAFLNEED